MKRLAGAFIALAIAIAVPTSKAAKETVSTATINPSIPIEAPSQQTVVGLGDSVTAASACNCTGFLTLYSRQLQASSHIATATTNLGVPGQTSAGLLAQLQGDPNAKSSVERADIVVVTIGANDFSYDGTCTAVSCYASDL